MKTIYIVRHGETDWNKEGRYQGITNIPLNAVGIEQAKACAKSLEEVHFDRIISSSLDRALVTAETIKGKRNIDIKVDDRLKEFNFGHWETKTFGEIEDQWPGMIDHMYRKPDDVRIPGGETFLELQDRAWAGLKETLDNVDDGETILVAAHGVTNRMLICKLFNLPLNFAWNMSQGNTCVNRIFYNGMGQEDHNVLNLLNDTRHLDDLP